MATHTKRKRKTLLDVAEQQVSNLLNHRNMQARMPGNAVEMVPVGDTGHHMKKGRPSRKMVLATN